MEGKKTNDDFSAIWLELKGRVYKAAKKATLLKKNKYKGVYTWEVYFGVDRKGKRVVEYVGKDKSRGESLVANYNKRISRGETIKATQIAESELDSDTYALKERLEQKGYTLREAVDWFEDWMPPITMHITVAEAWVAWEQQAKKKGLDNTTIKSMRSNYVGPSSAFYKEFKDELLHMITPHRLDEFIHSKRKKKPTDKEGWNHSTTNEHIGKIRQFYSVLIEAGYVKTNPALGVTRTKFKKGVDPDPKKHVFDPDAILSMLDYACEGGPITKGKVYPIRHGQLAYGVCVVLIVYGAVRLEECVWLEWRDLKRKDNGLWEITVRAEVAKGRARGTGKRRRNEIAQNASHYLDQIITRLDALVERQDDCPIVPNVHDIGQVISEKDALQRQTRYRKSWKGWCALTGARYEDADKEVAQNGLRHSCATYGLQERYDQTTMMRRMGEADAHLLAQRYTSYATPEEARLLFSGLPPSMRKAKAKREAGREAEIKDIMDAEGYNRNEAIGVLKALDAMDGEHPA